MKERTLVNFFLCQKNEKYKKIRLIETILENLTHQFPMHPFSTPENTRKPFQV